MSISSNDPRLREFPMVLQKLENFEQLTDPVARYEAAGEALYALREVLKAAGFGAAIEARFTSELPPDVPRDDPHLATRFQNAIARVWSDVMEALTPRGVLLTQFVSLAVV